jgi:hypothetical protein
MAKYAEVKEKQRSVDQVKEKEEPFNRGVWVGFTYKPRKIAQDDAEVRAPLLRMVALLGEMLTDLHFAALCSRGRGSYSGYVLSSSD